MSDFDEEAERERLREKYERDRQKREATERMSDLLLKGATMTNAHCGECGDPIFRHDGQEFCPSCETVVHDQDETEAEADAETETGAAADTADSQSTASPDETKGLGAGDESRSSATGGRTDSEADAIDAPVDGSAEQSREQTPSVATGETAPNPTDRSSTRRSGDAGDRSSTPTNPSVSTGESPDGSLSDARASLTRTVTALARRAEHSEDLTATREYLAAAREAAEALAAVNDADR